MVSPSFLASIRSLTAPVGDLGGRWMLAPEVLGPCKDAGYPNGFAYYVVGRGGVLGDVDADVIVSAFAFFEPGLVRKLWDTGVGVEGARASARRYGAACADFWAGRLEGFGGNGRLCELAERVIDGADSSGLALFAGWRGEQRPAHLGARAGFVLHLLREMRGSAHIVAVVASGLTPLEAVLATSGPEAGQRFGWSGPFADVPASAKDAAEALTDSIVAQLYSSSLGPAELDEFVALVEAAKAHLDA